MTPLLLLLFQGMSVSLSCRDAHTQFSLFCQYPCLGKKTVRPMGTLLSSGFLGEDLPFTLTTLTCSLLLTLGLWRRLAS